MPRNYGNRLKDGVIVNKTKNGKAPYLRISAGPCRGDYVHILVAEAKLGRKLLPGEEVDHLDGNGLNPHWSNLEVVSHPENMRRMNARVNGYKIEPDVTDGMSKTAKRDYETSLDRDIPDIL